MFEAYDDGTADYVGYTDGLAFKVRSVQCRGCAARDMVTRKHRIAEEKDKPLPTVVHSTDGRFFVVERYVPNPTPK